MKLSILIPAFNEIATIQAVIDLVTNIDIDGEKEIIIVDDGSTDGTREYLLANYSAKPESVCADGLFFLTLTPKVRVGAVLHDRNRGKGAALITAMLFCSGDVIVIQDADLEYDPADWKAMMDLIVVRKVADVVYGSRFYGKPHRSLNFHHYIANRLISVLFNILYNQTLTDIEVCYKMFTREVMNTLKLSQPDFGVEIQLGAQLAAQKQFRIYEMGISYYGRDYIAGKKINWKDGIKALWYLIRFRIRPY